jgi:hypothetical protein
MDHANPAGGRTFSLPPAKAATAWWEEVAARPER